MSMLMSYVQHLDPNVDEGTSIKTVQVCLNICMGSTQSQELRIEIVFSYWFYLCSSIKFIS